MKHREKLAASFLARAGSHLADNAGRYALGAGAGAVGLGAFGAGAGYGHRRTVRGISEGIDTLPYWRRQMGLTLPLLLGKNPMEMARRR